MLKPNGILTLTTDFGTLDGFVGAMKGRILTEGPQVTLCDISHDVAAHTVSQGAWCLWRAVPQFPPGTVHVAVVDPGVGSGRAAVVVRTRRSYLVGPDNGLLSLAAQAEGVEEVVAVNAELDWVEKSTTFDGLRLFSPVGARLAAGRTTLEELGTAGHPLMELPVPAPRRHDNMVEGELVYFDHFGNGITNITQDLVGEVDRVYLQPSHVAKLVHHYRDLTGGEMGALWNSDGRLELAYYSASLLERLQLDGGEKVRVWLK